MWDIRAQMRKVCALFERRAFSIGAFDCSGVAPGLGRRDYRGFIAEGPQAAGAVINGIPARRLT
jgi:hypothetical protein